MRLPDAFRCLHPLNAPLPSGRPRGQSLTEYGFIIALVLVVAIVGLQALASALNGGFGGMVPVAPTQPVIAQLGTPGHPFYHKTLQASGQGLGLGGAPLVAGAAPEAVLVAGSNGGKDLASIGKSPNEAEADAPKPSKETLDALKQLAELGQSLTNEAKALMGTLNELHSFGMSHNCGKSSMACILNPSFASKGLSLMSKGDALDKKVAQIDQMQANFLNSAGFHQLSASDQDYLKSMLDNNQNTQRTLLPADKSAFMDYAFGKTSTLQISNTAITGVLDNTNRMLQYAEQGGRATG